MFNWFRRKPPQQLVDRVWLNSAARLRAIVQELQAAPKPLVVVAFFPDSLVPVVAELQRLGLPHMEVQTGLAQRPRDVGIVVALASRVSRIQHSGAEQWHACVVEHHPLPSKTDQLLLDLQRLQVVQPVFHVALDEPLLRTFGGDKVASLMQSLGLTEDDAVEHTLVTNALARARDKLAARVRGPIDAQSMAQWFDRNVGV